MQVSCSAFIRNWVADMAQGIKARVRYIGKAHRRIVDDYEWNASNSYVQTVTSRTLVERLLANGDFELVQAPDTLAAQKQENQQE